MKKVFYPLAIIFFATFSALTFNACVDKDFDEPPFTFGQIPDDVVVNGTIAQLKALGTFDGIVPITEDIIIAGIVTSSDETGNFYKELYIQDETGGLKISLDINEIHANYQEGRKVYIKCQGLDLDEFSGIYTLGIGTTAQGYIGRIPEVLAGQHLFAGETNMHIEPEVVTIGQISGDVLGTLVTLEDVQFIDGELGGTFALTDPPTTTNRNLMDCNGNTIILRNSGYADFASETLPGGKGTVTGVASAFLNDIQLFVSRSTDLNMPDNRCDGSTGGGGTGNEVQMNIADVRALFSGTETTAPAETKIVGTIISDRIEGNIVDLNVVIQDATGGIVVRFNGDHFLNLNDEVEIVISGMEISEYNGVLQVNNVPSNNASYAGFGEHTAPATTTVDAILADLESYESTLVNIVGGTLTGGTTYNGGLDFDDATGNIDLYTRGAAAFSGALAPTNGEDVALVAIVSEFNGSPQITIRNLNDVTATGGGGGGGDDCDVNENFSSGEAFDPIDLSGWTNTAVEGTEAWYFREFDGNFFAEMTSYQATSADNEAWIVTPSLDLNTQKVMNFNSAQAFWDHDGLTVWFSDNFSGNVETATWSPLNPTLAGTANSNYEWVNSGDISLPLGGTGHVAFRYIGTEGDEDTSYRIDDLTICEE